MRETCNAGEIRTEEVAIEKESGSEKESETENEIGKIDGEEAKTSRQMYPHAPLGKSV